MIKLLWDFYGPDAEHTAKHHAVHLNQYANKNQLNPYEAGTDSFSGGASAWIKIKEEFMIKVRDDLKPKRGIKIG